MFNVSFGTFNFKLEGKFNFDLELLVAIEKKKLIAPQDRTSNFDTHCDEDKGIFVISAPLEKGPLTKDPRKSSALEPNRTSTVARPYRRSLGFQLIDESQPFNPRTTTSDCVIQRQQSGRSPIRLDHPPPFLLTRRLLPVSGSFFFLLLHPQG